MTPQIIGQTIPAEHVLGAALMYIHPANGNRYYGACEKHGGSNQDFVVYRRKPGQLDFEYIGQIDGAGSDATAFVTMGGGLILPNGDLEVWASGQPKDATDTSGSGFDAIGKTIPGVDDPWALVVPYVRVKQPAPVKMNPPAGFEPYGGANVDYEPSADGAHFFAQCGKGPQGFGEYVMRQEGTNKGVLIDYRHNGTVLDVLDGRGELTVGGDGWLYVTGTENDRDKASQAYIVDGYVPFARNIVMYGGTTSTGGGDTAALELKVAALTQQVQAAQAAATAAMARANYVKGIYEPVWATLEALENRPVGISRDEGWQLAKDAVYVDLGDPQSGNYARVRDIARQLVVVAAGGIDQVARDIANAALGKTSDNRRLIEQLNGVDQALNIRLANGENAAQELKGRVDFVEKSRPTMDECAQLIRTYFEAQWHAWVTYADHALLNLMWDRMVKLLRYKERTGKTAEQLPINDADNLKV